MRLFLGDCFDVLKTISDDSVDSLVTDPPAGISFMGKSWDSDKGGRKEWVAWMESVMRECMRVMKPGAHGLVWALPRTSHWTATALEDAGFEVRDVITHLFGQGFPKSLDISKAIDKAAGAEREVVGTQRTNVGMKGGNFDSNCEQGLVNITIPSTDDAKQWSGWGTALKPANEHWILIRKPISEKNVASNVLKWGTGGLNIDACRVGPIDPDLNRKSRANKIVQPLTQVQMTTTDSISSTPQGRFPSNLVFSHSPYCTSEQCDIECAIKMLDEQSGFSKSPARKYNLAPSPSGNGKTMGKMKRVESVGHIDDAVGASRFFYCAKISSKERGEDNDHPTVKPQKLMRYLCRLVTPPGGVILDPFVGSGSTGLAAKSEGFKFVGIERETEYFEIAKKRINDIQTVQTASGVPQEQGQN